MIATDLNDDHEDGDGCDDAADGRYILGVLIFPLYLATHNSITRLVGEKLLLSMGFPSAYRKWVPPPPKEIKQWV